MPRSSTLPPLDPPALRRFALRYVEKYATTGGKLRDYLGRKVRERGWNEDAGQLDDTLETLIEYCREQGFVDDASWAEARVRALGRRGFGSRRILPDLQAAGIEVEPWREQLRDKDGAWEAAVTFARRRRIGPFAATPADEAGRRRQLAAMARAGHGFDLARRLVDAPPGTVPKQDSDT